MACVIASLRSRRRERFRDPPGWAVLTPRGDNSGIGTCVSLVVSEPTEQVSLFLSEFLIRDDALRLQVAQPFQGIDDVVAATVR